MPVPHRLAGLAVAALTIVGAGACSDDDDGTAELSYCEALALLTEEASPIGPDADAEAMEPALELWGQVARTAPSEVADAARVMADAAAAIASDGSDADLDLDSLARASADLTASAEESCALTLTPVPESGG